MKSITKNIWLVLIPIFLMGQENVSKKLIINALDITDLDLTVYWGKIQIESNQLNDSISIDIVYDNSEKKELSKGLARLQLQQKNSTLEVDVPKPKGGVFESYDLKVKIPADINLKLKMQKGGDIFVKDIKGSIQIDNRNGSTTVNGAWSWITINNFNGEINVSYKNISDLKAISLITFNGGINLKLPKTFDADVVLKTKKNGWIESAFPVISFDGTTYTKMKKQYSKTSNQWNGRIGKGGTKLIAITNNGPIKILNSNDIEDVLK